LRLGLGASKLARARPIKELKAEVLFLLLRLATVVSEGSAKEQVPSELNQTLVRETWL